MRYSPFLNSSRNRLADSELVASLLLMTAEPYHRESDWPRLAESEGPTVYRVAAGRGAARRRPVIMMIIARRSKY